MNFLQILIRQERIDIVQVFFRLTYKESTIKLIIRDMSQQFFYMYFSEHF